MFGKVKVVLTKDSLNYIIYALHQYFNSKGGWESKDEALVRYLKNYLYK